MNEMCRNLFKEEVLKNHSFPFTPHFHYNSFTMFVTYTKLILSLYDEKIWCGCCTDKIASLDSRIQGEVGQRIGGNH